MQKYKHILCKALLLFYAIIIAGGSIFYLIPRAFFQRGADAAYSRVQSNDPNEQVISNKFSHSVFYSALRIRGQDNLSDLQKSILPANLILLFNSYAAVFGVMFYIFILQAKNMAGYFKRNFVDALTFLMLFIMALQLSDRFKIWLLPFIIGFFIHFLVANKMNLFELTALIILQIWLMGAFHAWSSSGNEYLARDSMRMTYEQSVKAFIFNMAMTGIFLAYMVSRNIFLRRNNVMKG